MCVCVASSVCMCACMCVSSCVCAWCVSEFVVRVCMCMRVYMPACIRGGVGVLGCLVTDLCTAKLAGSKCGRLLG